MVPVLFDHCVIHVSDWEISNRFYQDVLGAELVPVGERWAYRSGKVQLNIHGPGVEPVPVARLPVQPGNSDLCFVRDGPIGGAIAHLNQHHVEIELGPVERHGARGRGERLFS